MSVTYRKTSARILSVDGRHRYSRIVDIALILLISCNVLAIVLESMGWFAAKYQSQLVIFEIFSVVVFTIEYLLRIWSSVELVGFANQSPIKARLKYMLTPLALIDLIAILPFYLTFFVAVDLRFLRVVRLLRIFKLTRYSGAMSLVLDVFKEESGAFIASFFVLIIMLVLTSSGIYLLEHQHQPEAFGSIPAAMWWAMATLTTVGYGDVVPITSMGKLFGGLITMIGMGMVALPAGILASGFADQMRRRRHQYSESLERVLEDGVITETEEADLDELRETLGLSEEEVEELTKGYLQKYQKSLRQCPHCHKSLVQERLSDCQP